MKKIALILMLIMSLTLVGCWDYTELDKITIVTGFGIDVDENDQIIMTFQMLKPLSATSQGAASESEKVFILTEDGETVFDAIRNASLHASRKLYFAHNQVIILGKRAAETNPFGLLETFRREPESRTLDYILVAENTAEEVINGKGGLNDVQAQDLSNLVSNYRASGKVVPVRLADMAKALLFPYTSPIAPIVVLDEKNQTYLKGTAVFKDNYYNGELTEDETNGYLWITNKLTGGLINVNQPDTDTLMSFEIVETRTKLKGDFKETPTIKIEIHTHTNLGNSIKSSEHVSVDDLIKLQEDEVKKKIDMAINKAKLLKADIFGIGEFLHANYPKQWEKLRENWPENFVNMRFETSIEIHLKGHGLLVTKFKEK